MPMSERAIADCLVLGFYDYPFADYVNMLRGFGPESGAFQDLALAYVELDDQPMRALDVLTHFYYQGRSPGEPFHNADFLWPVVVYLTNYLRKRGFDADYVNLPHLESADLRRKLLAPLRTVAITTTVYVSPHPILALIEEVRRINPEVMIVVGGPYVFTQSALLQREELSSLLGYIGADVYVRSREGESTLAALLMALRQDRPLREVPNLAFRDVGGQFVFTPERLEDNELQGDIFDYRQFVGRKPIEFVSLRTAKSCPFACSFCAFPQRAGDYRYLKVDEVRRQLDALSELGTVSTVSFLDDTFNVPSRRFKDILRMMIDAKYGFKWNCFYRADKGDDETIDMMAQAGCEGVFLGVESGSDAMLALMNKSARRHHYVRAIERFRAQEIITYASLIIGFPGETDHTIGETIHFLEQARPDYYRAQLWYADPLTPIWHQRAQHRLKGVGFTWVHDTMMAQEACRWIDRIFLQVNAATWLPQFGFEPWSIYYLLRKGFSRVQIRTFLECFNAAIKHRVLTGRRELPPACLDSLRRSCQIVPLRGCPQLSAAEMEDNGRQQIPSYGRSA